MKKLYPSLSRLRALQAVCQTGSFSAAAADLLLTQPAVSAQIRQLERETGAALVERIGKSAKATPEGELLIASSARVFHELDTVLEQISEMKGEASGPLHIGAGATATAYLLPGILAELAHRHPRIKVQVLTGNTPDLVPRLLDASLDIAVLTAPVSSPLLSVEKFFEDRLVCIVPPDEGQGIKRLRPADFRDKRLILYEPGGYIRQTINAWLEAAEDTPSEILDIGSADAQLSFVRAGFGWAIISEMAATEPAAQGALKIVPLSPPLSRQLVLVWRKDRAHRPAIAAARDLFSRFSRSMRSTKPTQKMAAPRT